MRSKHMEYLAACNIGVCLYICIDSNSAQIDALQLSRMRFHPTYCHRRQTPAINDTAQRGPAVSRCMKGGFACRDGAMSVAGSLNPVNFQILSTTLHNSMQPCSAKRARNLEFLIKGTVVHSSCRHATNNCYRSGSKVSKGGRW